MRVLLQVSGTVQGVGFRPQVCRLAKRYALAGWVKNGGDAALIEAQGVRQAVEQFVQALSDLPAPIQVRGVRRLALADREERGFSIVASDRSCCTAGTPLAADLQSCPRCLAELTDPGSRRFGHAFIACSECGPRYSVTHSLPYDRARTSMGDFELCGECLREMTDPEDRRFHAQSIACPNCGPELRLHGPSGRPASATDPVAEAASALLQGKTLALLGIGGFQLLVDATNETAVARLRATKQRPDRPLAVLFRDLDAVRITCRVTPEEGALLASAAGPIVLLDVSQHQLLSGARGPHNDRVGAMLPTTGLHQLLMNRVDRPVVCTSGNAHGEPLCSSMAQVPERLGAMVDLVLSHNRDVVRPVDDSLLQWVAGGPQLLRRARGYVPEATACVPTLRQVLALGAHQRHTFTITAGGRAFTSPHLGDLDHPLVLSRLQHTVEEWLALLRATPEAIVCDAHPGYGSSQLAETLARSWKLPLSRVQHHHAHVAAAIAEWQAEGPVLGLAWDGSGLGSDGTLWGGEALLCDGTSAQRVGHLLPFQLPGGAQAMVEPRRSALGLLHRAGLWEGATQLLDFSSKDIAVIERALERGVNAPWTSSVGRLFDAVAAICGVRQRCSFEGQAAAEWMTLAERGDSGKDEYPVDVSDLGVMDWRPLLSGVLEDQRRQTSIETIARRFHCGLAGAALRLAARGQAETVALTGGCFQNRLLTELCEQRLRAAGFRVLLPRAIPPNDGGISVGQAWLACHPEPLGRNPLFAPDS